MNPNAPKGGTASQIALGSFDNFNLVVGGAKGTLVGGIEFLYDTLMVSALDEVASTYGLLAEAVAFPEDFSSATFRLRSNAKWHHHFRPAAAQSPDAGALPAWVDLQNRHGCRRAGASEGRRAG